ncbi:MAG: methyltransferase domain-containing protein [Longimicrobiales bacterium]
MTADDPLHPTTRFSNRVADYVRARPQYPDSLVQLLEAGIGLTRATVIADVGSGTGLSAEPFLKHGNTVLCVEPNAGMRAAAEPLLERYPGFRSIAGSAERTGLDDGAGQERRTGRTLECPTRSARTAWRGAERWSALRRAS